MVVSVLIHYFSLAAVMWMGAEAALMFHKLVFVFKKVTKKEMIVTAVVCWGELQVYFASILLYGPC